MTDMGFEKAQEAEWKKEQMQRRLAKPTDADRKMDETHETLRALSRRVAGYQVNQSFPVDFSRLHRFLSIHINNVGDPFVQSKFWRTNTHDFEREVVHKGLQLAGVRQEDLDSYWGYVTSGGTEGNLYGLHLARSIFPRAVVYYSRESHYSVPKSLSLLRLKNIMVRTLPGGAMDCEDLRSQLLVYRDRPAIIFANVGTTMKGAVDDISAIKSTLVEVGIAQHYIHCDAALHGFILPFLDSPPPWTFADGADSIAISGHKFLGCPVPCGLLLAKLDAVEHLRKSVDYIGSMDSTILGSRSGHAPLFMWYALSKASHSDFCFMVESCLAHADYAVKRLEAEGLQAWRHPYSPIVVFKPQPPVELLSRWQLAPHGEMAHIITMLHVTCELLDKIANDLGHWVRTGKIKPMASDFQDGLPASTPRLKRDERWESEPMHEFAIIAGNSKDDVVNDVIDLLQRNGLCILQYKATSLDSGFVMYHFRLGILHAAEYGHAVSLLTKHGYHVYTENCILVTVPNAAGALATIASVLRDEQVTVHSIQVTPGATYEGSVYGNMPTNSAVCAVMTSPDDKDKAIQTLASSGMGIVNIGASQLQKLRSETPVTK